jgi:hypothetical protein
MYGDLPEGDEFDYDALDPLVYCDICNYAEPLSSADFILCRRCGSVYCNKCVFSFDRKKFRKNQYLQNSLLAEFERCPRCFEQK